MRVAGAGKPNAQRAERAGPGEESEKGARLRSGWALNNSCVPQGLQDAGEATWPGTGRGAETAAKEERQLPMMWQLEPPQYSAPVRKQGNKREPCLTPNSLPRSPAQ